MAAITTPGAKAIVTPAASVSRGDQSTRPLIAGLAFPVFLIASVVVSSVPKNNASDAEWVAAYTGHAHQARHLATGILLVLAALSLLIFLTTVWSRIAAANPSESTSLVPLMAAGVSAAGIAAGGVAM